MDWVRVYDFALDENMILALQEATLGPFDFGVSTKPALVGTPEWWSAIEDGRLPRSEIEGTISKVYWASMGDWPEFEMVATDGTRSRWTREGDVSRYVEGLRVRLAYTRQAWKKPTPSWGLGTESKIVLRIDLEPSDRRSDPRAPGPGGIGLR
jgi:hypothetical protein